MIERREKICKARATVRGGVHVAHSQTQFSLAGPRCPIIEIKYVA
ncbi:hypothetical protein W911_04395 [Hyphomicrobium nitrativorans NL23]|uniref:Uncharacterized protein n=1 Tax=Hyphomicrobium nitrativorans NL23 TaxID=1029756 RepID=V5SIN0_9HYPH|nr:hypothetical protein W911_04395 [Hyphomicrobium nitrativorans NL23]